MFADLTAHSRLCCLLRSDCPVWSSSLGGVAAWRLCVLLPPWSSINSSLTTIICWAISTELLRNVGKLHRGAVPCPRLGLQQDGPMVPQR